MDDLQIIKQIEQNINHSFTWVSIVLLKRVFFTESLALTQLPEEIIDKPLYSINEKNEVIALRIVDVNVSETILSLICKLSQLEILDLDYCSLTNISCIKNLKKLKQLYLNNNRIENILPLKDFFKNKDFKIALYNNPLKYPPIEIINLGNEAINEYFEDAENGTSQLQEAKLIIIGEAGAGKTTFAKKILNPDAPMPKPEDTTMGIDVYTWSFSEKKDKAFNAKLWDFGGQDIYHGTHQFFFSEKSLYVLLADTREQKTDFNYWLNTVEQLTGENSPLIILLNKKQNHTWQIDEPGLRGRFGSIIRLVKSVDLSNVEEVRSLQKDIKEEITNLSHIGYTLPTSWVEIRKKLSLLSDKFIHFSKFVEICKESGIKNSRVIKIIANLFSNIGVFTYFSDETSSLQDIIFLDSNWLTKTVYLLLNSEKVKEKNGRINITEIKEIWHDDELYFEINKFIDLLKKFSLIYKINGSDNYIVPEHLPMVQPYIKWKYADENNIYQFRYLFDNYMPKGIMAKLIVALHRFIYDNNLVWHRGVNIANSITKPDTYAEIIETYGRENRFDIRIFGENTKELLQIIIYHFDRVLEPFKKLTYEKLVPCNCDSCKMSEQPYFFEYSKLLERKRNKKKTIECGKSPYLDVDIESLLEGIKESELRSTLNNLEFEKFKELIAQRFADISYQVHKEKVTEVFFHSVFHTILSENGLKPVSEESTNKGRIDLHLTIGQNKFLFEFKVDESADSALRQIKDKKYYQKFYQEFENIYLIGINFNSQERNIDDIKVINLKNDTK